MRILIKFVVKVLFAVFIIYVLKIFLCWDYCNCFNNDFSLIPKHIPNKTIFQTEDNICYNDYNNIEHNFNPYISNELTDRDHCETIYGLDQFDFVYVCNWEGDFSVVFATLNTRTNTTVEVALSWRQFCSFLFLSPHLLDDINYLVYSVHSKVLN